MASNTPTTDSDTEDAQLQLFAPSDKVTDQIKADQESSRLFGVANSIVTECKQARLSDLGDIVIGLRIALDMRPEPNPRRLDSLRDLFAALVTKYAQGGGDTDDLDEAIELGFDLSGLESRGSYSQPVEMGAQESYLVKSIADVQTRTRQSFEISNLDTAISLLREAILLQPEHDVKRSASLSSLAVALLTRFNTTSQLQDLDEAISLFNEALELPHEDRLDLLNNLCAALLTRFHATTEPQHFEAGVMRRVEVLRLEAAAMGIPDHMFYESQGLRRTVEMRRHRR